MLVVYGLIQSAVPETTAVILPLPPHPPLYAGGGSSFLCLLSLCLLNAHFIDKDRCSSMLILGWRGGPGMGGSLAAFLTQLELGIRLKGCWEEGHFATLI